MKKSYIALLIALVVVCLASCALAVAPCDPSVNHTAYIYVSGPDKIPTTVGTAGVDANGKYFYATSYTVPHTWKYEADSTATCVTWGKIHKKCVECGYEVTVDGVKDLANHADKTWNTKIQTVVATDCSKINTFVQLCSACNVAWETKTTCGPHSQSEVIVDGQYPTCTATGVAKLSACSNSKCVNKQSANAVNDGKFNWKDDKGHDGTETGTYTLPALGHLEVANAWYSYGRIADCWDELKEGHAEYLCGRTYSLKPVTTYTVDNKGNVTKTTVRAGVPCTVTAGMVYGVDYKYCDVDVCPEVYNHKNGDAPSTMAFNAVKNDKGEWVVTNRTMLRILTLKKMDHKFDGAVKKASNEIEGKKNGSWGDICYYEAKTCTNHVRDAYSIEDYIDGKIAYSLCGQPYDTNEVCGAMDAAHAKAYPHTYAGWVEHIKPADDHNGYWTNKCTFKCAEFICAFEAISINPTNDGNNPADKTVDVKKTQKPTVTVEGGKLVVTINDTQDADSYKVTVWVKGDKSTAKTYTTKTGVKKIKVEAGKKYCVTTAAVINTKVGPASSIVTKNVK